MGTSAPQPDPLPDVPELLQEETRIPAVPVVVEASVLTQSLPSRTGIVEGISLPSGSGWTQILQADPKRRRCVILAATNGVYLARNNNASVANAGQLPVNLSLVVEHCDALFAQPLTGAAFVSIFPEVWAD